jgi:hypothetical protein
MESALLTAWFPPDVFNKESFMMVVSHFITFVFDTVFRNTTDIWLEFFIF